MRSGHPYRASPDPEASVAGSCDPFDRASLTVLVLLWVATVVRVGIVFARPEPMTAEPSLAFFVLIALPWIAKGSFARRIAELATER